MANGQRYLPAIQYNLAIPTPAQYLGYEVGEWHVSHDQLVGYMRELDRLSTADVGDDSPMTFSAPSAG